MQRVYIDDLHQYDQIVTADCPDLIQVVSEIDWKRGNVLTCFGYHKYAQLTMESINRNGVDRIQDGHETMRLKASLEDFYA